LIEIRPLEPEGIVLAYTWALPVSKTFLFPARAACFTPDGN
jgi:hypothetical protein